MTLGEFFDLLALNPEILIFYFIACPLTALLAGWLGKGEGHISPWKYLYAFLVYIVCVPGIFAVTLNIYLFLFERQSIFDADLYTQILPIVSMVATLMLIRKNVSFDDIPGFGKIGAFLLIIGAILSIMWFADRTQVIAISFVPFHQVIIGFLILLAIIMLGIRRILKPDAPAENAG
ncbi:MAG: hypothetical protein KTR24_02315 [Saprospiraceae bacterium]|nr:hypothetical protein [Saprospiraceae bacterium]